MPGTFPFLHDAAGAGFDAKGYKIAREDQSIKTEMEGGYMTSRPRHTRVPRRTFSLNWRGMTNANKLTLDQFYVTMRGSSNTFYWTEPVTGAAILVRFKDAIQYEYAGMAMTNYTTGALAPVWNVSVEVEEV